MSDDKSKPKRAAPWLIDLAKKSPKGLKRLMKIEALRRGLPESSIAQDRTLCRSR